MRSYRWGLSLTLGVVITVAFVGRPMTVKGQAAGQQPQVTFTKDIAPIFQQKCQSCHRPGSVAPMSLITYEEARPWARSIKHCTSLVGKMDVMPPWFIEKDLGIQQYKDDLSLSDAEREKIAAWVDAGAPRGNPADLPPAVEFANDAEWLLGKPDLIVASPTVEVAAVQGDWWGSIGATPTRLPEDRYVASIEFHEVTDEIEPAAPGARRTVGGTFVLHHLTWSVDKGGGPFRGFSVGRNPAVFDPEAGVLLPAGSTITFGNAHLHANGRKTKAHMEIGFRFHPKGYKPARQFKQFQVIAREIDLRGNTANQTTEAVYTLTENMKFMSFEPHLHAAGVRQCLDAIYGDTVETLTCAGYNHGWVRDYMYAENAQPLLPKGTKLRVTSYFDTTPANRNVSEPRNWQGIGHRSVDNMAIGVLEALPLSDEEFAGEMATRRERLGLREGQTVIGCPLCGYQKKDADGCGKPVDGLAPVPEE